MQSGDAGRALARAGLAGSEQRGPGSPGHAEVNHFTAVEPAVIPSTLPVTARKRAFRFWERPETL